MHLSSQSWMRPEPLRTTLARLKHLGFSSIELAGEPEQYPIDEVRQLLYEYDIQCWGTVTIQTGMRDLTAADSEQRRQTIEYMKSVVRMSADLGGKIVTVVPGRVGKTMPTAAPEEEWRWAVEGLREVAQYAKEVHVKIGLEPLNRFETHFLNRIDQAMKLATEVGMECGIAFDPFHLAIEEPDLYAAMRTCGSLMVDFHVADNNRLAAGDGSFDWPRIMSVLHEIGYNGGLTFEASPPIDRAPTGNFGNRQLDDSPTDVSPGQLQFIKDHGSGLLSDAYYTGLLQRTAEKLRPFLS